MSQETFPMPDEEPTEAYEATRVSKGGSLGDRSKLTLISSAIGGAIAGFYLGSDEESRDESSDDI